MVYHSGLTEWIRNRKRNFASQGLCENLFIKQCICVKYMYVKHTIQSLLGPYLSVRHCFKYFICSDSQNSHINPMGYMQLLVLIVQLRHWYLDKHNPCLMYFVSVYLSFKFLLLWTRRTRSLYIYWGWWRRSIKVIVRWEHKVPRDHFPWARSATALWLEICGFSMHKQNHRYHT